MNIEEAGSNQTPGSSLRKSEASSKQVKQSPVTAKRDFDKFFDHIEREAKIYANWEGAGVFKPDPLKAKNGCFCITMPPPNANGELHMGHALGYVVMDVLGRYHRAQGKSVLLLPGKDHGGIQTQAVFEKRMRERGIDPSSLEKSDLFRSCYEFCIDRANYMRSQERALGIGADYDRETFTLDPKISEVVQDTFTKMFEDGLIYRGKRIINWSPLLQTSISNIEVESKEVEGHLYYIEYPFTSESDAVKQKSAQSLNVEHILDGQADDKVLILSNANTDSTLTRGDRIEINGEEQYVIAGRFIDIADSTSEDLQSEFGEGSREKLVELRAKDIAGSLDDAKLVRVLPYFDLTKGLTTATTRAETMFGDSALAVHPEDPRYQSIIGKKVTIPLVDRTIPIIADDRVDPNYGTGVVKITPAHDFFDFDVGSDHDLPMPEVIGKRGEMLGVCGARFEGLSTTDCRELLREELAADGSLKDIRKIVHQVPISERGKEIVQPLLSEQWWIEVDKPGFSLKDRVLGYLAAGDVNVHPPRMEAEFRRWISNLDDWNISRQIWWGHSMPIWYRGEGEQQETLVSVSKPEGEGWVQEKDTFDTWFSSGQWAFSSLAANGDLDLSKLDESEYFPNQCMQMGKDILFFWACRMLLMTAYRADSIPWKDIYFTGIVRDEHGQKMSKSRGNGIDPGEVIEKHGADALRLSMILGNSPGADVNIGEENLSGASRYINKIWNAGKLVVQRAEELSGGKTESPDQISLKASEWILGEIDKFRATARQHLEGYRPDLAAAEIYKFTRNIFCDRYLEVLKVQANTLENPQERAEAAWVALESFRNILQVNHPIAPFVTEEIWDLVPQLKEQAELLAASTWRQEPYISGNAISNFGALLDLASEVRSRRASLEIPPGHVVKVAFLEDLDVEAVSIVETLARVSIHPQKDLEQSKSIKLVTESGSFIIEHSDKDRYVQRLEKDLETVEEKAERLQKALNPQFIQRAPGHIVKERQAQLQEAQELRAKLIEQLQDIEN